MKQMTSGQHGLIPYDGPDFVPLVVQIQAEITNDPDETSTPVDSALLKSLLPQFPIQAQEEQSNA